MAEDTRRYQLMMEEDDPIRLDDVLEPYDQPAQPPREDDDVAQDESYQEEYEEYYDEDEDYSDYHEALDHESRVKTAMGVVDAISTMVGVVVILVLVAMLLSLAGWLKTDIVHSFALLQSGLQ